MLLSGFRLLSIHLLDFARQIFDSSLYVFALLLFELSPRHIIDTPGRIHVRATYRELVRADAAVLFI